MRIGHPLVSLTRYPVAPHENVQTPEYRVAVLRRRRRRGVQKPRRGGIGLAPGVSLGTTEGVSTSPGRGDIEVRFSRYHVRIIIILMPPLQGSTAGHGSSPGSRLGLIRCRPSGAFTPAPGLFSLTSYGGSKCRQSSEQHAGGVPANSRWLSAKRDTTGKTTRP